MRKSMPAFVLAAIVLAASAMPEWPVQISPSGGESFAAVTVRTWNGRRYCWYNRGWNGRGWYRCGFQWRRPSGWGGPRGWHGWP